MISYYIIMIDKRCRIHWRIHCIKNDKYEGSDVSEHVKNISLYVWQQIKQTEIRIN